MANATPEPANATTLVTVDPDDHWSHIAPDADGSISFTSEAEAETYAKEKGIAMGENYAHIGTVFVLLDGKKSASKSDKAKGATADGQ